MKKIEYLAANLPNGLKFKNKNEGSIEQLSGIDTYITANWTMPQYPDGTLLVYSSIDYSSMWGIDEIKPIVRSLSDLTKPITQANYNEGKEFVPIVELLKPQIDLTGFTFKWIGSCVCADWSNNPILSLENLTLRLDQFQLLMKLHFDLITEDCEKVYVTSEFDPYK
jgi:hypothetical protein